MFIRVIDGARGPYSRIQLNRLRTGVSDFDLMRGGRILKKLVPQVLVFDVDPTSAITRSNVIELSKLFKRVPLVSVVNDANDIERQFWKGLGVHQTISSALNSQKFTEEIIRCLDYNADAVIATNPEAASVTLKVAENAMDDMQRAVSARSDFSIASSTAAAVFINKIMDSDYRCNWLDLVQTHHSPTVQHSLEVANIMYRFACALQLSSEDKLFLTRLALVHDIGKLFVPIEVLEKPGALSDEEMERIRIHPLSGAEFLEEKSDLPKEIIQGVRSHHEYLDGSGYPDKLVAHQIPFFVRILTIADIYAALCENRPYKKPYSPRMAVTILWEMKGKLDRVLLKDFIQEFVNIDFSRKTSNLA